jgi:hypothetical protein
VLNDSAPDRSDGDPGFPAAFAAVAEQLLAEFVGDEHGRMLRSPGLKTGGKFYGFVTGDDLIVKLPAARVAELLASARGLPCSPRPGRPMREWVRIPAPDEASCRSHLLEARAFVSSAPQRQRR